MLARPWKGRPLRLTRAFALWVESRPGSGGERDAWIGRLDRYANLVSVFKLPGATIAETSADAAGRVLYRKYLPAKGHEETFLWSRGRSEALPHNDGRAVLTTTGEIVSAEPFSISFGDSTDFETKTRIVRLAGSPGGRSSGGWRWVPILVRFEP